MPETKAIQPAGMLRDFLVEEEGLGVRNPATGESVGCVRAFTAPDVEEVIQRMKAAWGSWKALTAKQRSILLRKWNDLILANAEELATLVTLECGKPLAEARGEVAYAASFIEWFAEEAKRAYGQIIPPHTSGKRLATLKQPVGLTAAITPWNFPLAMITRKAGPALAAGCPMIVKPAEATPLSALALERLAHEAGIPQDIFRVVPTTDPAGIGRLFCASPDIRKLSFTGSTRVGKLLLEQCASTVKRVSMELGGNAPFIVFDDADLSLAVEGAIVSKYRNAGQTCVCANRFLVQDGIHDAFVEALTARVSAMKVGAGDEPGAEIGPIINRQGVDKIDVLVRQACEAGAKRRTGGHIHSRGGNFFEPTVLTGVTSGMDIFNTEIFGPVAAISRFSDEAQAIQMANDTPYGLASYFYTQDVARAWRVVEQLEYGMVGVNDGLISTEVAPFGGVKESGLGREGASIGLDEYLEVKYVSFSGVEG